MTNTLNQIELFCDNPDLETIEMPCSILRMVKDEMRELEREAEVVTKNALDDLFESARRFRTGDEYLRLARFVGKFRFYSPYNAMLVYLQRPGATYVAPAYRWLNEYGRIVKAAAIPIVILRPRGPVMFVFDVSDTEPGEDAKDLPAAVTDPFASVTGHLGHELDRTIENATRDGVETSNTKFGSQQAGFIRASSGGPSLQVVKKRREPREFTTIPRRYEVVLNSNHTPEQRYVTLTHELAHLYCGHLGSWNTKYWPDRQLLDHRTREFEAESVSYVVCERLGIKNTPEEYLASFFEETSEVPHVSPEVILKAAGLIEAMGKEYQPLRKEK